MKNTKPLKKAKPAKAIAVVGKDNKINPIFVYFKSEVKNLILDKGEKIINVLISED